MTAYDVRISDWSSDVCSSDLLMYGRTFEVPKLDDFVLPIGRARIMKPGKDVTLVSYSIGVGIALEAAEKLADEEGIDAEVIDLRTLRPLDKKRSEERRVGKECVSTCSSRWSPYHEKKKLSNYRYRNYDDIEGHL